MPISRRQFIKRSAAAVTVGVVVPQWLAGVARGQQIELAGNRRSSGSGSQYGAQVLPAASGAPSAYASFAPGESA